MATVTIKCNSAPNSTSFKNSASVRVTYTVSAGTLKITEIEGKRTDGYRTYNEDTEKCYVTVGGVEKTVSISKTDFDSSWKKWSATDTTWSGITYSSVNITVEMPSGSLAHSGASFKTTSEISIPAKTYTVSYDANGGTGAPSSQTKTHGKTLYISSTVPTRTGYEFVEWKSVRSDGTWYFDPNDYTNFEGNQTLVAQWRTATYTVSYDANGGTGAPSSQTKTYGQTLTLSSTKPTRASVVEDDMTVSYTFKGWATSKTGAVSYSAGASYTKNASVTLYAVWSTTTTSNKFDVTYETGTGREIPSQTKIKGTALTLTSTKPSKAGFTFNKWNTKEDGSGTSYNSGGSYTTDADVLLYAIYTAWTHTVQYNANGGDSSSIPSSFTKTGGERAFVSSAVPTRDGYIFRYWNTASDGSGTTYRANEEYDFDKNSGTVTLYAIWALDNVSIYLDNGKCKSIEFKESSNLLGFMKGSIVSAGEFIEGDVLSIKPDAMYFAEIIEK